MSKTSLDVRIWKTRIYQRQGGKRYRVHWRVGTKRFSKSFQISSLAESHRASLITAASKGEPFSLGSGLPRSLDEAPDEAPMTWLAHAMDFVDAKWDDAAPKHRKSTAYGLMTVTVALTRSGEEYPDGALLRRDPREWSFNSAARRRSPNDRRSSPNR